MLFSLAAPPSSPGLPDSESDYGASQDAPASDSPPDLVELPYLSFSGVKCFARGEDATLAVTLRDLPEALREGNFPSATEDGNFLLVFSLKIADLAAIHAQAPRVVSAVQAAGISLPQVGGEGDLSQPQHKKKVSM